MPLKYESSGELSFSTMAQLYTPQNFNSRLGVGADDLKAPILSRLEARGSEPFEEEQHDVLFDKNIKSKGDKVKGFSLDNGTRKKVF